MMKAYFQYGTRLVWKFVIFFCFPMGMGSCGSCANDSFTPQPANQNTIQEDLCQRAIIQLVEALKKSPTDSALVDIYRTIEHLHKDNKSLPTMNYKGTLLPTFLNLSIGKMAIFSNDISAQSRDRVIDWLKKHQLLDETEASMLTFYKNNQKNLSLFHEEIARYMDEHSISIDDNNTFDDLCRKTLEKKTALPKQKTEQFLENNEMESTWLDCTKILIRVEYHEFFEAIMLKNVEKVKEFMGKGLSVNAVNKEGNTLVHIAAQYASSEIIDLILNYPQININAKNKDGKTPLHLANNRFNEDEQLRCIKKLLTHPEIDLNAQDQYGNTLLHSLLCSLIPRKSEKFILGQQKLDINKQDNNGNTPLHIAAMQGKVDRVKILLNSGATDSITIKNNMNKTPEELFNLFYSEMTSLTSPLWPVVNTD